MGVGLYIVWPAFYTDVTDAYRLSRGGRLRTDLGGVYFNALFVLMLGGVYALTGLESLLLVALLVQFEMVHQMLPFLRLDGYYVVADLVGVPDLFQRIRPILESFIPWREVRPPSGGAQAVGSVRGHGLGPRGAADHRVPDAPGRDGGATARRHRLGLDAVDLDLDGSGALRGWAWLEGIGGSCSCSCSILPLAGIAYLFWMLGRALRPRVASDDRPARGAGLLSLPASRSWCS